MADFNTLVDDDGSNTVGTPITKAQFQGLLMGATVARTDTGAVNNWAPGIAGHTFITWAGTSDAAFTGLTAGVAGQCVTVVNTGTKVATFAHNSGSSSAGNKFFNAATSAPTPIAAGGWVRYQYDGTQWRLVDHEQGAWITATFSAGHFTGTGAAWTVGSGDVTTSSYCLRGRTLLYRFYLGTTTVGAGASTLNITNGQWGGFTIGATSLNMGLYNDNGGGNTAGFIQATASGTSIGVFKLTGTFGAATDNTGVFGALCFDVT